MSRVRASAWTMATSTMVVVVTSLTGIVITPLLLRELGAARYGGFRALSDALGYLALLDIGFGGSVMACLAKAVNQREPAVTRKTLYNAVVSYCYLTALMLVCGLGFVYLLTSIVRQPGLSAWEVRVAGLILLFPVLLIPFSAFRTLTEAQQQGSIVNTLLMCQSLLTAGCALAAARLGWGLPGQSLAVALAQIPAVVVLVTRGVRQLPGLLHERRDEGISRSLWSLNWQTLVQNVCGRVSLLSDNILISWTMGPSAVAPFYLTQRLGALVQSQLQGMGNATWASLIQLHYREQSQLFAQRLTELTAMVSGLGSVALGVVLAYNHEFVRHWTGQASFAGEMLTLIACFNSWMWAISSLWGWPISGAGAVGRWVPYAVAFMTINVCTSVLLVKLIGWTGPLLGTTASFLVVNSWAQPRLLQDLFGVRATTLWSAALKPLLWSVPYTALIYSFAHSHRPANLGVLLAEMALAGGGGVLLWWTLGSNPSPEWSGTGGLESFWRERSRMLTTSILVPSYRRPEQLLRCIQSLERQTVRPSEVIVVWQGDDHETREACAGRRVILVHSPVVGIVPAENAGLREALGDVIFMIDDDAVAPPTWVEQHLRHYRDSSVGAVGGPADNYHPDGSPFPRRSALPVGQLTWHGKLHGNMFDQDPNWKTKTPEEVDHLVGYNLSFRLSALNAFETGLKPYWQMFELDACLQVRARGYRVLFDYTNPVEHYPTNTAYAGGRHGDLAIKIFNGAYNQAFILAKHSRNLQAAARLLYLLLVGSIGSPGLAASVLAWRRYGNASLEAGILWTTWKYRLQGWRAGIQARNMTQEAYLLWTSKA